MRTGQRGAALIVALLLLIVITLLGLASMRTSTLELRMATNQEAQLAAFERAQAVVDAAIADERNTIVVGDAGHNTCIGTPPGTACTNTRPSTGLADGIFSSEISSGKINVVITRLAPLYRNAPPGINTSADKFQAATFSVEGNFDDAGNRNGRTGITQGVLVLIPNTM
jgi:Tfp pilus assembly protein PilX